MRTMNKWYDRIAKTMRMEKHDARENDAARRARIRTRPVARRQRARGPGAGARLLRDRGALDRRRTRARVRAQRPAAGRGEDRRRRLARLRRAGALAAHARRRLHRGRRSRRARRRVAIAHRRISQGKPISRASRRVDWDAEAASKGGLAAPHAQGDLRTARRARAHGLRSHRPGARRRATSRASAGTTSGCERVCARAGDRPAAPRCTPA